MYISGDTLLIDDLAEDAPQHSACPPPIAGTPRIRPIFYSTKEERRTNDKRSGRGLQFRHARAGISRPGYLQIQRH